MSKKRIYVVGTAAGYANWMDGFLVNSVEDADLVLFTGGEDVDPSLYNEEPHSKTYSNISRDVFESIIFDKAVKLGKHIIGICRGSQFSCVKSGGRLVQHQQNPNYLHYITPFSLKKPILITSTHHQAQFPYNMDKEDYKVLAIAAPNQSKFHLDGEDKEMVGQLYGEVEICFYPKTKALAIQGHPEMIWSEREQYKETFEYLHQLLDKHLNDLL